MKKFLFLFAIAFIISTFTFPLAANAACTKYGTVVRVTNYADGYSTYHYIYMKTSPLSSIYFHVRTDDDNMVEIANNALTSQVRVAIRGSSTSCPISGYFGNLQYIVVNP